MKNNVVLFVGVNFIVVLFWKIFLTFEIWGMSWPFFFLPLWQIPENISWDVENFG